MYLLKIGWLVKLSGRVLASMFMALNSVPNISGKGKEKSNSGQLTVERYFKFVLFVCSSPSWLLRQVGLPMQAGLLWSSLIVLPLHSEVRWLIGVSHHIWLKFLFQYSLGFVPCTEYLGKWLASSFASQNKPDYNLVCGFIFERSLITVLNVFRVTVTCVSVVCAHHNFLLMGLQVKIQCHFHHKCEL